MNAYALAAAASGITLLACAPTAEAAPVCHELSVELRGVSSYALNPAGQIAAPFLVAQSVFFYYPITTGLSTFLWWNRAFFTPNTAGAMPLLGARGFPADLAVGAEIGPAQPFGKGESYGELFTYGFGNNHYFQGGGTKLKHRGNFNFTRDNYIGFEFQYGGKTHYGWARLRVTFHPGAGNKPFTVTHILGYGYETTPNTAIAAGSCATEANDGKPNVTPTNPSSTRSAKASLGLLALGSESIGKWREPKF